MLTIGGPVLDFCAGSNSKFTRTSYQFDRRTLVSLLSTRISERGDVMKIVVIGGTGLIGSKVVANLRQKGHEAFAAAPHTGVNTITGEGLREALAGAQVVIDLANSPSFEDKAALEFFETSGRNLLATEAASGSVRHHVALSIVGCDRTPDIGYFRAKVAQEKVIILEFIRATADSSTNGNLVGISPGLFQPIAADDVAAIVADVASRRRERHHRDRRSGTSAVQ
jgi:uncharacterized protein YbjT (DUF2867 family)